MSSGKMFVYKHDESLADKEWVEGGLVLNQDRLPTS